MTWTRKNSAAEIDLLAIVHCRASPEASKAQSDSLDQRGQLFQRAAGERWREAAQRAKDRGLGFMMGFGGSGGFGFDLRARADGKMHFASSTKEPLLKRRCTPGGQHQDPGFSTLLAVGIQLNV
jgi:hypothetical protein